MVSRVGLHVPGSLRGHTRERAVPDGLAMIEKLWSSYRGKRRHETFLEVDEEEDEVLEDKEDVNAVHNGGSNLHARGRGGGHGGNYKNRRDSHSSSLCFPQQTYRNEAYNCHGSGCPLAGNNRFIGSRSSHWGNGRGRGRNN